MNRLDDKSPRCGSGSVLNGRNRSPSGERAHSTAGAAPRRYRIPPFVKGWLPNKKRCSFRTFLLSYGWVPSKKEFPDIEDLKPFHKKISGILNKHCLLYENGRVSRTYLNSLRKLARCHPSTWGSHCKWIDLVDSDEVALHKFLEEHPYNPWRGILESTCLYFSNRIQEIRKAAKSVLSFSFNPSEKVKISSDLLKVKVNSGINWKLNQPRARGGIIIVDKLPDDIRESQAMVADEPPYILTVGHDEKGPSSCGDSVIQGEYDRLGITGSELRYRRYFDTLLIREKERKSRFHRNLELYSQKGGFFDFINMAVPLEDHCLYLAEKGQYARFDEHDGIELSADELSCFADLQNQQDKSENLG